MNKLKFVYFVVFMLTSMHVHADSSVNVSFRLLGGGWTGEEKTTDTEFKSSEGGQSGFNVTYQNGNFYTGINLQGGEYTFDENAPKQVTATTTTPVGSDKITRSELDFVFGYYLTRYFSVFLDIKGTSSVWASNNYTQEYSGVGIGVTGYLPINQTWVIHGSFGAISNGEIRHNEEKIGEGKSSGLQLGAIYKITGGHRVIFGIKSSTYQYEFDNGTEQTHRLGGAYVGYNYAFNI